MIKMLYRSLERKGNLQAFKTLYFSSINWAIKIITNHSESATVKFTV